MQRETPENHRCMLIWLSMDMHYCQDKGSILVIIIKMGLSVDKVFLIYGSEFNQVEKLPLIYTTPNKILFFCAFV